MSSTHVLTPREIVKELDKYIIGQAEAKRHVAIALRNRWRRMQVDKTMQDDIMPNNILMIGPTGVGKSAIARRLAKIAKVPFVKVEASKFTEVGYVGRDVESMVRDLVECAVAMVKAEKMEALRDQAIEQVEETILDILLPPLKSQDQEQLVESNSGKSFTREHFRQKLKTGQLDQEKIEIKLSKTGSNHVHNLNIMGSGAVIDEGVMNNIQDMFSGFFSKQHTTRKVTIAQARELLFNEEVAKLIDMNLVKEEAVERASNSGIIFIDEIDKIAKFTEGNGAGVSREGVQRDLLPIVEGSAVTTKYGIVHTDHILFIGAGAFHVAKPSDLMPELQGRFPIRVNLENLSQEDFFRILDETNSALPVQYKALLAVEDVELQFDLEAKKEIAAIAYLMNEEEENIGARRLQTVMSHLLNPILFDVPEVILPGSMITITQNMVKEVLADLVEYRDLSKYIL